MAQILEFLPRESWVEWGITIQQCNNGEIRFEIHDLDDPETPEQARRIAGALQRMIEHLHRFANGESAADSTQED